MMECCTKQQEQFAAYISGKNDTAKDSLNNDDSSATALKFASLSQLGFMLLLVSLVSALVWFHWRTPVPRVAKTALIRVITAK